MKTLFSHIIFSVQCIAVLLLGATFTHAQQSGDLYQKSSAFQGIRDLNIDEIYSSDFFRDSSLTYLQSASDADEWTPSEKLIYRYDAQGREIEILLLGQSLKGWLNRQHFVNSYFGSTDIINQYESAWDDSTKAWLLKFYRNYTYSYKGLVSETIENERIDNKWVPSVKNEYHYNFNDDISEETLFEWNGNSNDWGAVSQIQYNYDSKDFLSQEIHLTFNDSLNKWENKANRQFFYNVGNLLERTTRGVWSKEDSAWVSTFIMSWKYDSKGQVLGSEQYAVGMDSSYTATQSQEASYDNEGNIGEVVHSQWNAETESWIEYKKQEHFWSEHITGNLGRNKHEIECFFSNPYIVGLPWYCNSLKANVKYTVEVYDLWGRKFYSANFMGHNTFRIDNSVPPGMYTVLINGGLDYHSEKIIIRD